MSDRGHPRAGHLAMVGISGPRLLPEEARLLRELEVAGVLLLSRNVTNDREALADLCGQIQAQRPEGDPPILVAADQEGGSVAPLAAALGRPPSALALGMASDPGLTEAVHAETARRCRSVGVHLVLAPVADVVGLDNPVVATRSFGTDPLVVGQHVEAAIRGLRRGGTLTCTKHWPGHGRPPVDSHQGLPVIDADEEEMLRRELPPFGLAIAAQTACVMVGHLSVPALDPEAVVATVSRNAVTGWLRRRLGFGGVILTDAFEMMAFAGQEPAAALAAGCDLLLWASPVTEIADRLEEIQSRIPGLIDAGVPVAAARDRILTLRREVATAGGAPLGDGEEDAYAVARRLGAVALWPHGPQAPPWPPQEAVGEPPWGLVDAASADRLLRTEGDEDPAAPAAAALMAALTSQLGPPAVARIALPAPGDAMLHSVELARRLSSLPREGGWIVASLRPFYPDARVVWRRAIADRQPRWIALLGDLSLAREVPPDVGVVLLPGAGAADAAHLGGILRGRWAVRQSERLGG